MHARRVEVLAGDLVALLALDRALQPAVRLTIQQPFDLTARFALRRGVLEGLAALTGQTPQVGELPAQALASNAGPYQRAVALLSWAQHRMRGDTLATEQLFQASLLLHRVHGLLALYHQDTGALAWMSFLPRILRGARIGLFGEPLSGVQVMGLLESRALDHDRVVLVGAQEGSLPSASVDRSFVPFEIRRHYKLPLRDSTDAVQAYNFLRIVQHAQEVVLIYADDGTGQGPSRFIAQLEQELPGGAGALPQRTAHAPVSIATTSPLTVPSNAPRREHLVQRCASGLSPTMLGAWLRCPLDHWFRYVLGLREPEMRSASIPANLLGEAVHEAMHQIIAPWRGEVLSVDGLEDAAGAFPAMFRAQLAQLLGYVLPDTGQPLLQMNMAERAGAAFLRGEARLVSEGRRIVPLALETECAAPLANATLQEPVLIKGRIDRVDERDGVHTLLDLKTGRVDAEALRIIDLAEKMIRLSGKEPGRDIAITITGLRPGEKRYEELLASAENTLPTHHPRILIGKTRETDARLVREKVDELVRAAELGDTGLCRTLLRELVPEYSTPG